MSSSSKTVFGSCWSYYSFVIFFLSIRCIFWWCLGARKQRQFQQSTSPRFHNSCEMVNNLSYIISLSLVSPTCKGKDGDRGRSGVWSSKNTSVCSQQAGSLICQKQVRHIVEEIVGMDDFTDDSWHASCAGRWMFVFPSNCHNFYDAFLKWLVSISLIKVTIHWVKQGYTQAVLATEPELGPKIDHQRNGVSSQVPEGSCSQYVFHVKP